MPAAAGVLPPDEGEGAACRRPCAAQPRELPRKRHGVIVKQRRKEPSAATLLPFRSRLHAECSGRQLLQSQETPSEQYSGCSGAVRGCAAPLLFRRPHRSSSRPAPLPSGGSRRPPPPPIAEGNRPSPALLTAYFQRLYTGGAAAKSRLTRSLVPAIR